MLKGGDVLLLDTGEWESRCSCACGIHVRLHACTGEEEALGCFSALLVRT